MSKTPNLDRVRGLASKRSRAERWPGLKRSGIALGYRRPVGSSHVEIAIEGPIGDRDPRTGMGTMLKDVERRLAANDDGMLREIVLVVNSPGGYASEASAIYELLREQKAEISAVVTKLCASAAVEILLAADRREAARDAKFLIHGASIELESRKRKTAVVLAEMARLAEAADQKMVSLYSARTGTSPATFSKMMNDPDERRFGIGRAIDLGLIHAPVGEATRIGGCRIWDDPRDYGISLKTWLGR